MKKIIIGVIVIAIILVGGYFAYSQMNKPAVAPSTQTGTINNPDQTNPIPVDTTATIHEVIYTDSGYSPSTLTIKVGDTVRFKNQSSGGDWVGSANHPTHTVYSGTTLQQHCPDPTNVNTAFDECKADKPGDSWSFTFTKAGTWGYHNHVNARFFGKIVVE